ncbi:diguanylate cyclase domain-containing protein [Bacterioplanoides sp.]|uniref:sensor domain-containing diguanylate cyclase n=1 Tax=Bacterioplanoides sp. TaxID=2066072 RepID=UPI003AFF9704
MLTIRQIALILSGIYLLLLFVGFVLARAFWFYPQELNKIQHIQQREIDSISSLVSLHLLQQLSVTIDYAQWNDVYAFVASNGKLDQAPNIVAANYTSLGFSASAIMNNNGDILLSQQLQDGNYLSEDSSPVSSWFRSLHENKQISQLSQTSGLYRIEGTLYIISIADINNSEGNSRSNGYFLFAKPLSKDFWHEIRNVAGVSFSTYSNPDEHCRPISEPVTEHQQAIQRCLTNPMGQTPIRLEVTIPDYLVPKLISSELFLTYMLVAVIPLALYLIFLGLVTEPLRYVTSHLRRSKLVPLPEINPFPQLRVKELEELRSTFNRLQARVQRQRSELTELSLTDELSGIGNRRAFEEKLQQAWRRSQRHQQNIALILVDIDHFKPFNDIYGHQLGDSVIRQVGKALASCVQRQDEYAFRYGGEEFVLLCYVRNQEELGVLEQHIKKKIQQLEISHKGSPTHSHLTVSFGVAWLKDTGSWLRKLSTDDWFRAADAALYEAKDAGRNCCRCTMIDQNTDIKASPVFQRPPPAL